MDSTYKFFKFRPADVLEISFFIHFQNAFQNTIQVIIDYNNSEGQVSHAIIRSLTFSALGLRNTCRRRIYFSSPRMETEDHGDLQEIRDEQQLCVKDLEGLTNDLHDTFERDGLPLMDFL